MKYAPSNPTTAELAERYPLQQRHRVIISSRRQRAGAILKNPSSGLFVGMGGCALTEQRAAINGEGNELRELEGAAPGLVTVQRLNTWKPRTDPNAYHGLETTDPETAYRIVTERAIAAASVAMEIGYIGHLQRYHKHLTFGWIGARAEQDDALLEAAARVDPELPIGVKNGLDGSIKAALQRAEKINELRAGIGAPAVLLYRGGKNAQTAEMWEDGYIHAWEATGGQLIVDTAHGGEMAHHPQGIYEKSPEGQNATLDHLALLAISGYAPAGVLVESSNTRSDVDPNLQWDIGIGQVAQLYDIKMDALPLRV